MNARSSITNVLMDYKFTAILGVATVIALWIVGISPVGILLAAWWPCIFVLQFALVITPWRTVQFKHLVVLFLIGTSIVPLVTFVAQWVLYSFITIRPLQEFLTSEHVLGNYDMMGPIVAPITEEFLKVAPVLVILIWGRLKLLRYFTGPLDIALLGGASGAGFGYFEHLFRVLNNDWGELGPSRTAYVVGPEIGSLNLFPELVESSWAGVDTVWFGHASLSAFVCLALGLGIFIRHETRLWPAIPGIALAWAMWDHFLWNYIGPNTYYYFPWVTTLGSLDRYGRLVPWIFLAGVLFSIFLAHRTEQWYNTIDKSIQHQISLPDIISGIKGDLRSLGEKLYALWRFHYLRRVAAYGMYNFVYMSKERPPPHALYLAAVHKEMLRTREKVIES